MRSLTIRRQFRTLSRVQAMHLEPRLPTEPLARSLHHSAMDELTRLMTELGATDPAGWAASELSEDIPQQARFLFLRSLWPDSIDSWGSEEAIRRIPAGKRLLDAGTSADDLSKLLRAVAYETAFSVVARIDEGYDPDAPEDAPGWILLETGTDERPTGRVVGGLHESLLELDSSGREGGDLWQ